MRKQTLSMAFVAIFTLCAFTVQAQEKKIFAGGGVAYATDLNNIGFLAKGLYQFTPQWEAEGSFTYFLKKNYVNWSALDFNAHYLFYKKEKIAAYGLAGLDILFWKIKFDTDEYGVWGDALNTSSSNIGLNLGTGMRYQLSDKIYLNPELKYTVGNASYLSISVGLLYNF